MEKINQYILNKVFTVPYIDKLITSVQPPDTFVNCVTRYVTKENVSYGNAISEIYEYMGSEYRNEYYYKNTLLNELLLKKHNLHSTAALTELPIGNSKADFVMINGKGIVYEIKTDLDNLLRLQNQIDDYFKVFSYVNVVVGRKQLGNVNEFLMDSKVGIIELTSNNKLISRKKAGYNRDNLDYETMFQLLRKHEFEYILNKHFNKLPKVNAFEYYRECLNWIKKINIITLQKDIMECLKRRTLIMVEKKDYEVVPNELSFYAYFSKKYRQNSKVFKDFLEKEVGV